MLLNSNDIFEQIGLVVDRKPQQQSAEELAYSVYLEIELSEGKHQLLEIRSYDEPHQIAVIFCKRHKLNSLAIEIVENKIREAKYREEVRRRAVQTQKKRIQTPTKKNTMTKIERQHLKTRVAVRGRTAQIKSISRSRSGYSRSPARTIKTNNNNQIEQQGAVKKKGNPDIGNQLYSRAMMKSKIQQNQRQKYKAKKQKEELKQLTFQPKINPISAKIAQFRKQNPKNSPKKQNKKATVNALETDRQAMKQCTFKPQINKVSSIIVQNSQNYNQQYDHFTALYQQAQIKQDKLNSQIDKSQVQLFQPKINSRYRAIVKQSFEQRLERSLLLKKKQHEQKQFSSEQYCFKPKIGRAPKDSRMTRMKDSAPWQQLHQQKLKKSHTTAHLSEQNEQRKISQTSHFYYENLVDKRVLEVFEALDGDEDGFISPQKINIQNLTKNQLVFLKPVFEEMEQLEAELDYNQFKKAIGNLMKEADPSSKGTFLSQKQKIQEKSAFRPLINQKSKQMMLSRITTAHSIYDQLYEQGLHQLQKKEHKLQVQKARQEQKQVEQCTFKPQLNNTSKYYIDKVLGKKISQRVDEDQNYY